MADISIRKYIRWLPGEASESTSTIVLTSSGRYFVDIRVLNSGLDRGNEESLPAEFLDWAFAGTSSSVPAAGREEEGHGTRLAKWTHWVDSRTAQAESVRDEGLVRERPEDGPDTSFEAGRMVNPVTGLETDYEEVWQSFEATPPPAASGRDDGPLCVALRVWDDARGQRGMVIRLGQFIQGILRTGKKDEEVTVERWEWDGQVKSWKRKVRFGTGSLPIPALTEQASTLQKGEKVRDRGREWTVLEVSKG